jgi:hypothetical protein
MAAGKWFDAAGKPDPMQAKRQGFVGCFLYFGTPGFGKNCTKAYYQAVQAAGLAVIGVVEHNQHDAELGAPAGASYAQAGIADMAAQGAAGWPLGVTADEHLTVAQIPTAVAFQAAASHVIRSAGRQSMGYGFAEFIRALRSAHLADIEWQAGSQSLVDGLTHFWQDNTATELVGHAVVDRNWKLRDYAMTTLDPNDPIVQNLVSGANSVQFGQTGVRTAGPLALAMSQMTAQITTLSGALSADEATILGAIQGADNDFKAGVAQLLAAVTAGGVDVHQFAVALAPVLGPLLTAGATPAQIGNAVADELEARLAATPAGGAA